MGPWIEPLWKLTCTLHVLYHQQWITINVNSADSVMDVMVKIHAQEDAVRCHRAQRIPPRKMEIHSDFRRGGQRGMRVDGPDANWICIPDRELDLPIAELGISTWHLGAPMFSFAGEQWHVTMLHHANWRR